MYWFLFQMYSLKMEQQRKQLSVNMAKLDLYSKFTQCSFNPFIEFKFLFDIIHNEKTELLLIL